MRNKGDLLQGRYRILESLGAGSAGTVYLVEDLNAGGTRRALKILDTMSMTPEEMADSKDMFQREIVFLKSLSHPGLPACLDSFCEGDINFLVMEYVRGETLEARMIQQGHHFDAGEVVPWALQLAEILAYLHGRSPDPVIYRDLKPSNIILTVEGRIRLIDFGIARYFKPGKTKDTYFMGTPGFSAPEQYGSGQSDARTDIFSFGATLYYLMSGEDITQFNFKFPRLSSFVPDVPPPLERMIMRCLAVNPGERYQSVKEIIDELTPPAPRQGVAQIVPAPAGHGIFAGWYLVVFVGFVFIGRVCEDAFAYNASLLVSYLLGFPVVLVIMCLVDGYLRGKSSGRILAECMMLLFIAAVLYATIIPNFLRASACGSGTGCKSNLKNIATALEMYAYDNKGEFPSKVDQVTPNYLKVIPTCGSAGENTYMYARGEDPATFTMYCRGRNHRKIYGPRAENYPQYSSSQGLLEP